METNRVRAALLLTAILAACTDSPIDPGAPRPPASVRISAGNAQSATAGERVATAPAVVVTDETGAAVAGVTVHFRVTAGGGTVQPSMIVTSSDGVASAASWTLGDAPGPNTLEVEVDNLPVVRFTATATSPYHIAIRYIGSPTPSQQAAVEFAVERWRSVVTRDLPDVPLTASARECFASQPAFSGVVDDLMIYVELVRIDGSGGVLGQAGPCYIRSDSRLPIMGHLQLDTSDLVRIEAQGSLNDLILHEIGHVLGFGTLWTELALLQGSGSSNPEFLGASAITAYRAIGGAAAGVPVENSGSAGTRDGHWRESVFSNELMTGYLQAAGNPLSAVTIGSLRDLGYTTAASAASAFTFSAIASAATSAIDLHAAEIVRRPTHRVDRRGEKTKIER